MTSEEASNIKKDSKIYNYIYYINSKHIELKDENLSALFSMLPDIFKKRCSETKNEALTTDRFFSYALLLCALMDHGIHPDECSFAYTKEGKLYIENKSISVSISHTNGMCFVMLNTEGTPVGIDGQMMSEESYDKVKAAVNRFFPHIYEDYIFMHDYVLFEDLYDEDETTPPFIIMKQMHLYSPDEVNIKFRFTKPMMLSGLDYAHYIKWCAAEAVMKLDGRGFGAISELDNLFESCDTYTTVIRSGGENFQLCCAITKK